MTAEKEMTEQPLKPILQKPPGYRGPMTIKPDPKPLPNRKLVLPPSFYHKKKKSSRRSCCRVCCCCFLITLVLLLFLLLAAAAAFYLWFDPKLPVVRVGSFRVQQFNFTDDKATVGSLLTAQTAARLEITNPSGKLRYYYGDADVAVNVGRGDDETSVGSTKVNGFKQEPKNTTSVTLSTQVRKARVDAPVAKRLALEYKSKQLVVNVEAKTKVGLGVRGLRIGMLRVNLRCGGLSLKTLDSEIAKCTLNTLKWINIRL